MTAVHKLRVKAHWLADSELSLRRLMCIQSDLVGIARFQWFNPFRSDPIVQCRFPAWHNKIRKFWISWNNNWPKIASNIRAVSCCDEAYQEDINSLARNNRKLWDMLERGPVRCDELFKEPHMLRAYHRMRTLDLVHHGRIHPQPTHCMSLD